MSAQTEQLNSHNGQLTTEGGISHGYIQMIIEQFLQNYARLSAYRLSEVFVSTVMVLIYLLKARSNAKALD